METVEQIAKELVVLFPKIIRGAHGTFPPDINVTLPQMQILMTVHDLGKASISTLAHQRKVSLPTVTGMTERMIKLGLLERIFDPGDRRKVFLQLTETGKKVIKTLLTAIKNRWKTILLFLSHEEQEAFLKAVKRMVEVLNEIENLTHQSLTNEGNVL